MLWSFWLSPGLVYISFNLVSRLARYLFFKFKGEVGKTVENWKQRRTENDAKLNTAANLKRRKIENDGELKTVENWKRRQTENDGELKTTTNLKRRQT